MYDKDSNAVKVAVSHFSVWGLLVDLLKTLTAEAPKNIKAQLTGKKSAKGVGGRPRPRSVVISWDAPEGATGPYDVQALRVKGRIKSGDPFLVPDDWSQARIFSAKENKVRIRRPSGVYIFRVKVRTSEVYSEEVRLAVK